MHCGYLLHALCKFVKDPGQLSYRRVYQTMEEEHEGHLSYMKIVNAGEKLIVNRHEGNLQVSAGQSHAALGSRDR